MAYKRYYKKKSTMKKGKRSFRKRNYVNKAVVAIGNGFPKMTKMRQHYVETVVPTAATVAFLTASYRLNSLYNPRVAGGGHQPYYFDQMMAVYDHFTVIGTKVSVCVTNTGTAPLIFGGYINDDSTVTPTSLVNCQEAPMSQWALIPPGNEKCITLTWKWSAKKFFTKDRQGLLADINLTGTASADPGEASVLTLYYQSADLNTTTGVTFAIRMDFISIYSELKDIVSS